jgi:hypothetical protein
VNCYGFLGRNDARLPLNHVCYTCLFAKEPRLLKDIVNRVQYRRACYLLRAMTFNGNAELTEALRELFCSPVPSLANGNRLHTILHEFASEGSSCHRLVIAIAGQVNWENTALYDNQ